MKTKVQSNAIFKLKMKHITFILEYFYIIFRTNNRNTVCWKIYGDHLLSLLKTLILCDISDQFWAKIPASKMMCFQMFLLLHFFGITAACSEYCFCDDTVIECHLREETVISIEEHFYTIKIVGRVGHRMRQILQKSSAAIILYSDHCGDLPSCVWVDVQKYVLNRLRPSL